MNINQMPQESMEAKLLREFHDNISKHVMILKERAITDAVNQFEKDLRKEMGTFAINLANYYTVERDRGSLVITVRLEGTDGSRTV